jgi:P-type Mg2+ transporter
MTRTSQLGLVGENRDRQSHAGPAGVAQSLELVGAASEMIDQVLEALASQRAGLTAAESAHRLTVYGHNVLPEHRVTVAGVLLRQLRNPLLILLAGAAIVSAATGDPTDAIIIGLILTLSVGLGFTNEYRSERAALALHSNIHHQTVVTRDGQRSTVDVADLVPGDVVELSVGSIVPADLRLIEAARFECDEAVLTGESAPAAKSVTPVPAGSPIADLSSCAFMGTVVHQGTATGVVIATGASTAFGKIAAGLSERPTSTAFQVGLKSFSKLLVAVAAVLTVSIFVINLLLSRPLLDALLFSLAIAIGITPQLLPAIVSVSLASGSRHLARSHVLVKRLVTIEDLGNIQLLFTDKTGTLTEGTITFDRSVSADGTDSPEAFLLGLLCNEATMTPGGPVGGNALDQALYRAPNAATVLATTDGPNAYRRLGALPFDHDRQLASVIVVAAPAKPLLITKGAPEVVLARCVDVPAAAAATLAALFADGARTIAIATREMSDDREGQDPVADDEHQLRFAGFITFVDRPKQDAGAAIHQLNSLGIEVKIITGDNGAVAGKVCHDIGIEVSAIMTGEEIERLDDDALAAAIPGTTVFARVSPDQKARIVKTARRDGADVAFMGDGVNDAVALHVADVGISVESATDVAKDAADIVLLDKDLGVLATGVTEGRRIFANTLKYVLMATSSNFGNMFSAAAASVFLTFLPMLPSQILLNGLLYDVGQLAIPTDNVDPEVLARPAGWDIKFVRRFMFVFGPISSLFDITTFLVMIHVLHAGQNEFRTGWFVESLVTQTLVVFLIRTRHVPFFHSRPSLPMIVTPVAAAIVGVMIVFSPAAHVLGFVGLPMAYFFILFGMVGVYLVLIEAAKSRFYRAGHQPSRRQRTEIERHEHRVRRRAARFVRHVPPPTPTRSRTTDHDKVH